MAYASAYLISLAISVFLLLRTNAMMRNSVLEQSAELSLLHSPDGSQLESDIERTTIALDSTYPYNQNPSFGLSIAFQASMSLMLFLAAYRYIGSLQGVFLASAISIFAALAILDIKTTWLPRKHSIWLSLFMFLGLSFGVNPFPITPIDLVFGCTIIGFLCFLANFISENMKGLPCITEGDTFYLIAMAALIGPDAIYVLLIAVVAQAIAVKLKLYSQVRDAPNHAPFGPALFVGLLSVIASSF